MSETTFTRGPWVLKYYMMEGWFIHSDSENEAIARIEDNLGSELSASQKANSALIAAAPDLYAALKEAILDVNDDVIHQRCLAALAKARGEG